MSQIIRVEVRSKELSRIRPYNGKHYGEQQAAIYNGGAFPLPFKLNVEQGHEYEPGEYTIDPRSFVTDEMGNLKLKGTKLLPLGGAAVAQRKVG